MITAVSAFRAVDFIRRLLELLSTLLPLTAFFWPSPPIVKNGEFFDIIIIGAGSAGCILANRLSEDPTLKVLVIEAGGNAPISSVLPGLLLYQETSNVDWKFTIRKNNYTSQCDYNKTGSIYLGKMLGGTSSINIELYQRGFDYEYDIWADSVNDPSWKKRNLLPFFKKSENIIDEGIANSRDRNLYGYDGNIGITKDRRDRDIFKFIGAFVEQGNRYVLDPDGQNLGYGKTLLTIANGARSSSAYCYLRPVKDRPNLYVLRNTLVTKILIRNNVAIGVEALAPGNKKVIFRARKEVIVSAGPVKSPQLLMLSGIGPKSQLDKFGIPVVKYLPVGQNLQDHVTVVLVFILDLAPRPPYFDIQVPFNPHIYPNPVFSGTVALNKSQPYPGYTTLNYAPLTNGSVGILQFCVYFYRFKFDICQRIFDKSIGRQIILSLIANPYPKSRGSITLNGTDPRVDPIIDPKYFSNVEDLRNNIKAIKDFIKVLNSKYFKEQNAILLDPPCPRCKGLCGDEYWSCYSLCMMQPMSQLGGSCAMGSVVDNRLRVYGVRNLRVVDGSVMPVLPSGGTFGPTAVIAEKAASMIKEDIRNN